MQIVGGHIGQKPSHPYRLSFKKLSRPIRKAIDLQAVKKLSSPALKRSNVRYTFQCVNLIDLNSLH